MRKKLTAFSLVEMIITLGILSIVFLLTTKTLTTLVQVSTVTKYKTATRSEADFTMELVRRFLSNSKIDDMYIFDSLNQWSYTPETGIVATNPQALSGSYTTPQGVGQTGNELHVRLSGYDQMTCIGFFKEDYTDTESKGYILKKTVDFNDTSQHYECFLGEGSDPFPESLYPVMVLNAKDITVKDFLVSYAQSESSNNIFYVDLMMEPLYWAPGMDHIEKAVVRQSIVTTQGLTWY
jgi:type II secretory pathway pseudopilin PulG